MSFCQDSLGCSVMWKSTWEQEKGKFISQTATAASVTAVEEWGVRGEWDFRILCFPFFLFPQLLSSTFFFFFPLWFHLFFLSFFHFRNWLGQNWEQHQNNIILCESATLKKRFGFIYLLTVVTEWKDRSSKLARTDPLAGQFSPSSHF